MIKLVISDVDGTLINVGVSEDKPTENMPNAETMQTIVELKKAGYTFGVASGRQYPAVKKLFPEDMLKGMVFCCENGSLVVKDGKVISKTVINRADFEELIADIDKTYPDTQPLISGQEVTYLINPTDEYRNIVENFLHNETVVVSSVDEIKEDIIKVAIFHRSVKEIAEEYKAKWGSKFTVAIAGDMWLDFTLTDKGTGIEKLCKAMEISTDEVMVFGDNFNDIPMLDVAGTAIAMETAKEEVKKHSTDTCTSVAKKCREMLL